MALYKNDNGNLSLIAGGTLYADAPIGAIQAFGGSVAPSGWLLCQGQAISRTTYADLFAVIGTNFGVGDGSTTFNLPDPREASLVGAGTNTLNASSITTHNAVNLGAFQDDQLQEHNHYRFTNTNGGSYSGVGGTGSWTPTSTYNDYGQVTGNIYNGRKGTTTHGKQLGVNYIIKAKMLSAPADFMEAVNLKYIGTAENTVSFSGDLSKYQELILLLCPFKTASSKTFYTFNLPTLFFNIQSSIVIPQDISADGQFSTRITVSATGVTCASMGSAVTEPKVWIYGR